MLYLEAGRSLRPLPSLSFWQRRMAKLLPMVPGVGGVPIFLKSTLQSCLLRFIRGVCAGKKQIFPCPFSQLLPPSCAAPYGYAFDCIEAF